MQQNFSFPEDFGTRFSLTVDTEEEFEWGGDLSRDGHGVSAVPALRDGQRFFAQSGVAPLYYVDTPVLNDPAAQAIFQEMVANDGADFGVHLHPWVTPPFDEQVSRQNSYAGNLPEELERAKIRHVRDLIRDHIGVQPIAYRAGRYGIGPNSYRILAQEGFVCDSSVRNLFDYRGDGGPDFRWETHHPYWTGPDHKLLEIPLTSVFVGHAGSVGRRIFGRFGHVRPLAAALARTGLITRVPLTPEGIPADIVCEAIDVAIDVGIRLMTMSFHSPSLAVGHTPYVRTAGDLTTFYQWFDTVFNHCAKRGVQPARLDEILRAAGLPV
ncbi:MAG: polysaccharide deacetylase family protein [Sphingopyxis sp.]